MPELLHSNNEDKASKLRSLWQLLMNQKLPVKITFLSLLLVAIVIPTISNHTITQTIRQHASATATILNGDQSISSNFNNSQITIRTSNRTAGAISSITWNGQEFVDSTDHGRELQTALSLDGLGECYNPTEAGSADDGTGNTTSSMLEAISAAGNHLTTKTNMAFWGKPGGEPGLGCPANNTKYNTTILSNFILTKDVTIGFLDQPNIIKYNATITVPEYHDIAGYEVATGYMPQVFNRFYAYQGHKLVDVTDQIILGNGKAYDAPVIIATADGKYAMGAYAKGFTMSLWNFGSVSKWSCDTGDTDVTEGNYSYTCYIPMGSLQDVVNSLNYLDSYFQQNPQEVQNISPKGSTDTVSCTVLSGWTCDSNNYNSPLTVKFYEDGTETTGTYLGQTIANQSRPDLTSVCSGSINHGFSLATPVALLDGKNHTIYMYSNNLPSGKDALLTPIKNLTCQATNSTVNVSSTPPSSTVGSRNTENLMIKGINLEGTGLVPNETPGVTYKVNSSPKHITKGVEIVFHPVNGGDDTKTQGEELIYDASTGTYRLGMSLPALATGNYLVYLKPDGYLRSMIGTITIPSSSNQTITTSKQFVAGDLNNNNIVDLTDYNTLISCMEKDPATSSCQYADINDDGSINDTDVTLFLQAFSAIYGQ